jgi:hypothetical protein
LVSDTDNNLRTHTWYIWLKLASLIVGLATIVGVMSIFLLSFRRSKEAKLKRNKERGSYL